MPIYGKKKKKKKKKNTLESLLQIQESFEAESWYIALGTQNGPWMTWPFYREVEFVLPYFFMRKTLKNHFLKMY